MIVAGFGFRKAATVASLRSALDAQAAGHEIAALATAADKATAQVFQDLSAELGLRVMAIPAAVLGEQVIITHSEVSISERNTGSLAEAAALAAAGPGAQLLGPRAISTDRMATCALAEGGKT